MTAPLFPPIALGPLRAVIQAELVHVATLTTAVRQRLPTGTYRNLPPIVVEDVPCLLTNPTAQDAEIAAARGIEMQVRVLFALGTTVQIGTLAAIAGADADGNEWVRAVTITATDFPDALCRVCAAIDTQLNQ